MNHFAAMDDPIAISQLIDAEALSDVLGSVAQLHSIQVTIVDTAGALLCDVGGCGFEDSSEHKRTIEYGGDVVGRLTLHCSKAMEPSISQIGDHLCGMLQMLIHSSYARFLTTTVHEAAMEETLSELRESNTRLSSAVERLEELEGLKSGFLSTISHELRTPLTSIIGYSEMLSAGLAGDLSPEQKGYVKTILSKSDQLLQLITGVLDISLIEANSLRLNTRPIELGELIARVAGTLQHDLERRNLVLELPSEALPKALADEAKLKQVIVHLLANAIKFSPDGGDIQIRVCVGALTESDTSTADSPFWRDKLSERFGLRVTVIDQGIGIPEEQRSAIFEPFFQIDSGTTRAFGGPGLGLSLAHSYITAHGGFLWVEPKEVGDGSAFTFTIPIVPEELEMFVDVRKQSVPR